MTESDPRLKPFAEAETLTWHRHTVFTPHRGDDGNLCAGETWSADPTMPLDTYLPAELEASSTYAEIRKPFTENGVGIVVVDPATIDDVHDAVRQWCRDNLGRDDITFD